MNGSKLKYNNILVNAKINKKPDKIPPQVFASRSVENA